jgi:hypothetical protein
MQCKNTAAPKIKTYNRCSNQRPTTPRARCMTEELRTRSERAARQGTATGATSVHHCAFVQYLNIKSKVTKTL